MESLSEQSEAVGLSVQRIQLKYEENEHSLELHLPYIQKCFKDAGKTDVKLVPLMVGKIPADKYHEYAKLLLPLFSDERTIFIISSDFCHWGSRFGFTHKFDDEDEIYKSIERLDKMGMDLIEQ